MYALRLKGEWRAKEDVEGAGGGGIYDGCFELGRCNLLISLDSLGLSDCY